MGAIEFGQLIKQARIRRGMLQQDLAGLLNVDPAYLSAIESGKRTWPRQYIPAIAEALGLDEVEMARTAGLISPAKSDSAEDEPTEDPLLNVVMHDARNLTPEGLEALRDIVRGLLKMQERTGGE